MANLYAGDRVYSIHDGLYGKVLQPSDKWGHEYAIIQLEGEITEACTRIKKRLIKLHPEDQFGGKIELKESTDQDKTIAELQDAVDRIKKFDARHENRITENEKALEDDRKQITELIDRVKALEKARQQDVENSRQMKEMLISMVKQWEAEDEQESK